MLRYFSVKRMETDKDIQRYCQEGSHSESWIDWSLTGLNLIHLVHVVWCDKAFVVVEGCVIFQLDRGRR